MQELTLAIFNHMEERDLRLSRENGIIRLNNTFNLKKIYGLFGIGDVEFIAIKMKFKDFYHDLISADGIPFENISRMLINDDFIKVLEFMKVFIKSKSHYWPYWFESLREEPTIEGAVPDKFDEIYEEITRRLRESHYDPELFRDEFDNYRIRIRLPEVYEIQIFENASNETLCFRFERPITWHDDNNYVECKINTDRTDRTDRTEGVDVNDATVKLWIPSRFIHPDYHRIFTETDEPNVHDKLDGWN